MEKYDFYKNNEGDTIYWVDNVGSIGEHLFSFDKKKIYNLFADYPHNLSAQEKQIFDKENPYWADFSKTEYRNMGGSFFRPAHSFSLFLCISIDISEYLLEIITSFQ